MSKTGALLIAGLAALVIVGCGGSSESSSESSNGPSREKYTAQADAICRQAGKDLDATIAKELGTKAPNQQQISRLTREEVLPNLQSQLDELRKLPPPEADEKTVNSIYDTLEKGIADLKQSSDITKIPQAMNDASRMAREYGFKVCGAQN